MIRLILCWLLACGWLLAEVKTMTFQEVIGLAIKQNPDVMLARLDNQKARDSVRAARDPFVPKVYGGSGLAYTVGYPNSIDGNAPSIFQLKTDMALYNRPKSYELAQARENARGAEFGLARSQDEMVYRTAVYFYDARQAGASLQTAERQVQSLEKVRDLIHQRVAEGRELEQEEKRAAYNLARARQRVQALLADQENAETMLALAVGLTADDRVRPAAGKDEVTTPESEDAAVEVALSGSKEIRQLESKLQSKGLEIRGYRSQQLPQVDLVAQYSLFARYNYADFFRKFSRNNAQLGISLKVPLIVGSAARAYADIATSDQAKLRIEVNRTRDRIKAETRRAYQELAKSESALEVARLGLDVTRGDLSIALAQFDEGRVLLAHVEELRVAESDRWMLFYEAQHNLEVARLNLLRMTGTLLAALK